MAIQDYKNKQAGVVTAKPAGDEHDHEHEHGECFCPYCEEEIVDEELPYCQACRATLRFCPECGKPITPETKTCPHGGMTIKS